MGNCKSAFLRDATPETARPQPAVAPPDLPELDGGRVIKVSTRPPSIVIGPASKSLQNVSSFELAATVLVYMREQIELSFRQSERFDEQQKEEEEAMQRRKDNDELFGTKTPVLLSPTSAAHKSKSKRQF